MFLLGLVIIGVGAFVLFMGTRLNEAAKKKKGDSKDVLTSILGNRFVAFVIIIAGILVTTIPQMFFWAEPGYQYFLVSPSGKKDAVLTEGIKWRGFAKVTPWQKYIDVKVVEEGDDVSEIEGQMEPIPIRFIDQVTATVSLSTRFQLPADAESFIKLAIEFRSLRNLVQNTLIPTVREVVTNTGYMFAAQDYISGAASDFRVTIDDQLKNGTFSVEKIEYRDTIKGDIQEENERSIKEIQVRYELQKRLDEKGFPIRIAHDINENNVIVAQVIVGDVSLEPVFKKRLEAQRDESAKRQLEQQKIKTARDAQARIIAEGERDKAAERVVQEKEQVRALIEIETQMKQEKTKRDLAEIALKTARLQAEAQKVKAEAEAYQNAKLVSAGLTPQERAKIEKEKAIGIAAELSKINFPEIMIVGDGGNKSDGGALNSLIGAAMAKQLLGKDVVK